MDIFQNCDSYINNNIVINLWIAFENGIFRFHFHTVGSFSALSFILRLCCVGTKHKNKKQHFTKNPDEDLILAK
jgi:hypothetical protein